LAPGTLIIDMSSSEPARTQTLARRLGRSGVAMIDAPVSGGVSGAERASLTIMVGAPDDDLERARVVLSSMGRIVHAGGVGAGHAVKALNNLLSATHLLVTSEAMIAGQRFGLDPDVMLAIINGSSGKSGSTENKWPNFILPGTYNTGFGIGLMVKDMRIALDLAEGTGAPSLLGADATAIWVEAASELPADADHTEIARWLQERAARLE
jgi:3-hydroxyisobutyrate dehydrogenase